jgi:putative OPT family oligopeptide transporter
MASAPTTEKPSEFAPYVPAEKSVREFTVLPLITGTALGLVFAASSLYLVLKVGMTVSASIPVAVLAISLFRAFSRSTILENNIVQTAGSAGESIAFGVGVTMPALMMLGFQMSLPRVMVVSILGGILGILAMIPLRRAFIVKMHGRPGQPGTLLYPEGVACAQVLISGDKGGTTGRTVFIGFGIAFVHKFATLGLQAIKETIKVPITVINKAAAFAGDMASELLGVGYIIGFRTSAMMMAGAVLGYLVIIPLIYFVGKYSDKPIPPATASIQTWEKEQEQDPEKDMISRIRNNYLLYIGAGCVATAGLISMVKTMPMIVRSVRSGLATVRGNGNGDSNNGAIKRTDNDMSMRVVLLGSLGLLILLALFLMTEVSVVSAILGALLVLLFGFLFVTVSARLTGEIGSSSNPISGMTVATLMVTCLIFLALGMISPRDRLLALSIAAVVCIASSNGGTTAQSLKTGFLVGGTPKAMQYAILFGALISALVIGGTLIAFNAASTVYSDDLQYLPQEANGKAVVLSTEERARLDKVNEDYHDSRETYNGKEYLVWDTRREVFLKSKNDSAALVKVPDGTAPDGRFLVDPQTGQVAFLKDPTVGGVIKEIGDRKLTRFDAPKTKVMHIIIDGVLSQKLNWSLVLIGALIAITMDLCGVSALAFAVGVYVPIQYSVPIFIGGIVRAVVDRYLSATISVPRREQESDAEYNARVEVETIRRTETSPGVLLSSGYIAGGSLAGVVAAFLEFEYLKPVKKAIDLSKSVEKASDYVWFSSPFTFTTGDAIALLLFGLLIVFALAVGTGKLLKAPPRE